MRHTIAERTAQFSAYEILRKNSVTSIGSNGSSDTMRKVLDAMEKALLSWMQSSVIPDAGSVSTPVPHHYYNKGESD